MTIVVTCPSCGSQYQVRDELAGRAAKCKKCGQHLQVPVPDAAEASTPPASAPAGSAQSTGEFEASHPSENESDGPDKCPMCGASVLPDAEVCLLCEYKLKGEPAAIQTGEQQDEADDEADEEEIDEDRRVAELLAPLPETLGSRISTWAARISLILLMFGIFGYAGWSIVKAIQDSRALGRIDALAAEGIDPKADLSALAARLADEIPSLPSYLEDLADQAERIRQSNQNVSGLKFVEGSPYDSFHIGYGTGTFDLRSQRSVELPNAWRKAAAVTTMIVNLPEGSDIEPLMKVSDAICLPAVHILFNARTDLDWQIDKSCDPDEAVRSFAASLLASRLGSKPLEAADLEALAALSTPEEKRQTFQRIEAKMGKATPGG